MMKKTLTWILVIVMVLCQVNLCYGETGESKQANPVFSMPGEREKPLNNSWETVGKATLQKGDYEEFYEVKISDATELAKCANLARENKQVAADLKITLVANIDLSGKEWTPFDVCVFDGNGYTVRGVHVVETNGSGSDKNYGFINEAAEIKNLRIIDSKIDVTWTDDSNTCTVAGIAGKVTEITGCSFDGSICVENKGNGYGEVKVSGITCDCSLMTRCTSKGEYYGDGVDIAGCASYVGENCTESNNFADINVKNGGAYGIADTVRESRDLSMYYPKLIQRCTNNGSISTWNNNGEKGACGVAGYVQGYAYGSGNNRALVSSLRNEGSVSEYGENGKAAGVIGSCKTGYAVNCRNTGDVSAPQGYASGIGAVKNSSVNLGKVSGHFAGGIKAYNETDNILSSCSNEGLITGEYAGGIAAENYGNLIGCSNKGNIIAQKNNLTSNGIAGGITAVNGVIQDSDMYMGKITGSVNYGKITGRSGAGGIAGMNGGEIKGCYNSSEVSTDGNNSSAGGICGKQGDFIINGGMYYNNYSTIEYCENYGNVTGHCSGGIVGTLDSIENSVISGIQGCINNGNISSKLNGSIISSGCAGGIAGGISGTQNGLMFTMGECENSGRIEADIAGGIFGYLYNYSSPEAAVCTNLLNKGEVTGQSKGGGIFGQITNLGYSYYLVNRGSVNGKVKGLIFGETNTGTVTDGCYHSDEGAGIGNRGNAEGETKALNDTAMHRTDSYSALDFGWTWKMNSDNLPELANTGIANSGIEGVRLPSTDKDRLFYLWDSTLEVYDSGEYYVELDDGTKYSSFGGNDVVVSAPDSYTGNYTCGKEGYISCSLPSEVVGKNTNLSLKNEGYSEPYAQALFLDKSEGESKYFDNLLTECGTVNAGRNGNLPDSRLYLIMNSNGYELTEIVLKQDNKTISLSENTFNTVVLGETFSTAGNFTLEWSWKNKSGEIETDSCPVYLKLNSSDMVSVRFDMRGGMGNCEDLIVPLNGKFTVPEPPVKEGYVFTGWYRDSKCKYIDAVIGYDYQGEYFTDEDNVILYAGWRSIKEAWIPEYDNYSFNNKLADFPDRLYLTSAMMKRLYNDQPLSKQMLYCYKLNKKFDGVCAGMSILQGLVKMGRISPADLYDGASHLTEVPGPKSGNQKVLSAITYYHTIQSEGKFWKNGIDYMTSNSALAERLVDIYEKAGEGNTKLVLIYIEEGKDKHAVLAYKMEEDPQNDEYVILCSDSCYQMRGLKITYPHTELRISKDFYEISYSNENWKWAYDTFLYRSSHGELNIMGIDENFDVYDSDAVKISGEEEESGETGYLFVSGGFGFRLNESGGKYRDVYYSGSSYGDLDASVLPGSELGTDSDNESIEIGFDESDSEYFEVSPLETGDEEEQDGFHAVMYLPSDSGGVFFEAESEIIPGIRFEKNGSVTVGKAFDDYYEDTLCKRSVTISAEEDFDGLFSVKAEADNCKNLTASWNNGRIKISTDDENGLPELDITVYGIDGETEINIPEQANENCVYISTSAVSNALSEENSGKDSIIITNEIGNILSKTELLHTVAFDYNGGYVENENSGLQEAESVLNDRLSAGSRVSEPAVQPERAGYTFDGWFADENCTEKWDFSKDAVEGYTVIYAGWKKDISQWCRVTFNVAGKTSSAEVLKGSRISEETVPDLSEYGEGKYTWGYSYDLSAVNEDRTFTAIETGGKQAEGDIETVGNTVRLKMKFAMQDLTAIVAVYDQNRKMIACSTKVIPRGISAADFEFSSNIIDGNNKVKLFLLDKNTFEPLN